jgi:hypothetical protein
MSDETTSTTDELSDEQLHDYIKEMNDRVLDELFGDE